jgi:hypothetical protein
MAPILGIYASQISGHLFAPSGAYDSIATATASGSSPTLEFTSIPSTYTHLQIRMLTRSTRSATSSNIYIGFNSDTTTGNYNGHMLQGDGSSASASGKIGSTTSFMSATSAASNTSGIFSGVVIDVLDYANTSKYKTSRGLSGYDANGSGLIYLASGLWMNTNAVTSIQITDPLGNFASGSVATLYGIKGN